MHKCGLETQVCSSEVVFFACVWQYGGVEGVLRTTADFSRVQSFSFAKFMVCFCHRYNTKTKHKLPVIWQAGIRNLL